MTFPEKIWSLCIWYFTKKVCTAASVQLALKEWAPLHSWFHLARKRGSSMGELLAKASSLPFISSMERKSLGWGLKTWGSRGSLGCGLKMWGSRGFWGHCLVYRCLLEGWQADWLLGFVGHIWVFCVFSLLKEDGWTHWSPLVCSQQFKPYSG